MIVQKYGGSSLATIEKMQAIAERIIKRKDEGEAIIVVVSAMGKTTNDLINLAKQAAHQPNQREMDLLLATGEQVSTALLSMMLNERGYKAISLTGFQAGIQTAGIHTKNKIIDIDLSAINTHLSDDTIIVIAGFQGINDKGAITTLGRGGSDTSAVALAAKCGCACEIYTDVTGIYGVNPTLYPQAKKLDVISYDEMAELASLGAKVMEPRAVEIAQKYGVQIYVAAAHGSQPGTLIKEVKPMIEQRPITGLSVMEAIAMVTLNHFPNTSFSVAELFMRLAENEVNIDMISQTLLHDGYVTLAFTCDETELATVQAVLDSMLNDYKDFKVNIDRSVAKLSIVGLGMRSQSGIAASMFKLLSDHQVQFSCVTTSEISISYTIPRESIKKTVALVATKFNL